MTRSALAILSLLEIKGVSSIIFTRFASLKIKSLTSVTVTVLLLFFLASKVFGRTEAI